MKQAVGGVCFPHGSHKCPLWAHCGDNGSKRFGPRLGNTVLWIPLELGISLSLRRLWDKRFRGSARRVTTLCTLSLKAPRTYCVHPAARETPCRYNNHTVVLYTSSSLSLRARSCEQRANLKFLAKLGKTPYESFTMLQQVYGEETMSRTRAFEWHKRFKEGRGEVEDDPRSGRPSTSRTVDNIECVKQMVRADRRLTVRMIGEELSINKDTVWSIITENLEMRTVYSKMVPKLLSKDQKQQRVTVC
uniref:Mos1 transposase HTH domain-containing protein n=1 Tax=Eptatretus burgeri TaxID=7764 RepID=A0A8C4QUV3_EPTBU